MVGDLAAAVEGLEEGSGSRGGVLPVEGGEELLGKELDLVELGNNDLGVVVIGVSEGGIIVTIELDHHLLAIVTEDRVGGEAIALKETVGVTEVGGEEDTDLGAVVPGELTEAADGVSIAAIHEGDIGSAELLIDIGLAEKALVNSVEGGIVPTLTEEGAALGARDKGGARKTLEHTLKFERVYACLFSVVFRDRHV